MYIQYIYIYVFTCMLCIYLHTYLQCIGVFSLHFVSCARFVLPSIIILCQCTTTNYVKLPGFKPFVSRDVKRNTATTRYERDVMSRFVESRNGKIRNADPDRFVEGKKS